MRYRNQITDEILIHAYEGRWVLVGRWGHIIYPSRVNAESASGVLTGLQMLERLAYLGVMELQDPRYLLNIKAIWYWRVQGGIEPPIRPIEASLLDSCCTSFQSGCIYWKNIFLLSSGIIHFSIWPISKISWQMVKQIITSKPQ